MSRGVFLTKELPKPEYQALRWLVGELDASQWEVVCTGIRLAALMLQGTLDLGTLHQIGQPQALRQLLQDFRSRPTDVTQQPPLHPPHAKLTKPPRLDSR